MDKKRIAKKIVKGILEDISDRAGLGDELSNVDSDIKKEIREAWEAIILNALDKY